MPISWNLFGLALQQLVGGACKAVGCEAGAVAVEGVAGFLTRHFTDHSQRLGRALAQATEQTWRALEIALAGDSLWDRCKQALASSEHKAFRQQVQPFLDACPLAELHGRGPFRQEGLRELQAARKAGHLVAQTFDPAALARQAAFFAPVRTASELVQAESRALVQVGDDLGRLGYPHLAELVSQRPAQGESILVLAMRYFFRRAVEQDGTLFQALAFAQMERLQEGQDAAFRGLQQALAEQGGRWDQLLADIQVTVVETHDAVMDVREEQRRQGQQNQDLYRAVTDLLGKVEGMQSAARPGEGLTLRNDAERALVQQLVQRFRALPEGRQRELPALLNALDTLEVAAADSATVPAPPATPPRLRLRWVERGRTRTLWLHGRAVAEAGRHSGKDLCLRLEPVDDPANRDRSVQISSHHFTLRYLGEVVELIDPGSSNGTFVAGMRLPAGQPRTLERGLRVNLAEVLDLVFDPVPRPDVPAGGDAVVRAARSRAGDAAWLQQTLIGADRPGRVAFVRVVRKNNLAEEEYILLFHAGVFGPGADALVRLQVPPPAPGRSAFAVDGHARILVQGGRFALERLGAEPVLLGGVELAPGRPLPLTPPCTLHVAGVTFGVD